MPYNVQVHDVEINTLVVDYYPPHPHPTPPPKKNMQNANKNQEKMTKLVTGH